MFRLCLYTFLVFISVNGQETFNFLWPREFFRGPNFLGHSISDHTVSIFDGRIIVSVPTKQKQEKDQKGYNLCVSSKRQVGFCTKLSECKGFNIATLHNNICFFDIFVPGVCCDQLTSPQTIFRTTSTERPTTTASSSVEKLKHKKKNQAPLTDAECGVNTNPSFRIVSGDRSEDGKWPWMAALYANTFLGRKFHCGGSLISDRHVLTGAHCVKGPSGQTLSHQQLAVRLGDSDISTLSDSVNPGKFYSVQEIRAHPNFQNINHYFLNDVAVLKLHDKVPFSSYIFPVCLPTPEIVDSPLDSFAGQYSTILGFGRTELGIPSQQLQEAIVPIWKNNECDSAYFAPITDIFICAGYKTGGIDACQGDSGGPMQIEKNGRWTQIGITSFGKGCGEAGFPGVYTRVSKFMTWVKDNMV